MFLILSWRASLANQWTSFYMIGSSVKKEFESAFICLCTEGEDLARHINLEVSQVW